MNNEQTQFSHLATELRFWESVSKLYALIASPEVLPPNLFFDIYGVMEQLLDATVHSQIDGRRGSGKTALMIYGYHTLKRQFESDIGNPPYSIAIYVNLEKNVTKSSSEDPKRRADHVYKQILKLIIQRVKLESSRKSTLQGDDRIEFWDLKDFAGEIPNIFHKVRARSRVRTYQSYVRQGDWVPSETDVERSSRKSKDITLGGSAEGSFLGVLSAIGKFLFQRSYKKELSEKGLGRFMLLPTKVHTYLEALLEAMKVKQLILFLDEWSGQLVGFEAQPYLYNLLKQTFPHNKRVKLKLATIPGLTMLPRAGGMASPRDQISLDDKVAEMGKEFEVLLFETLIRSLAFVCEDDVFPLRQYLNADERRKGFPKIKRELFEDDASVEEFIYASEGLPRQMLKIFMQSSKQRGHNRKIAASHIRWAAAKEFSDYAINVDNGLKSAVDTEWFSSLKISELLKRIFQANSRVFEVEQIPMFFDSLDILIADGVIGACQGKSFSGYNRYYLCYPAEVYRLWLARKVSERRIEVSQFDGFNIDRLEIEEYDKPPKIPLARLGSRLEKDRRSRMG